jgi:hypothetical protein
MNFSAMELYALIHDLEQQRMANQTRGPVRDDHSTAFKFGSKRRSGALDIRDKTQIQHRIKTPITFYSYKHTVSQKLCARQNPVGHSRTRLCPWGGWGHE